MLGTWKQKQIKNKLTNKSNGPVSRDNRGKWEMGSRTQPGCPSRNKIFQEWHCMFQLSMLLEQRGPFCPPEVLLPKQVQVGIKVLPVFFFPGQVPFISFVSSGKKCSSSLLVWCMSILPPRTNVVCSIHMTLNSMDYWGACREATRNLLN